MIDELRHQSSRTHLFWAYKQITPHQEYQYHIITIVSQKNNNIYGCSEKICNFGIEKEPFWADFESKRGILSETGKFNGFSQENIINWLVLLGKIHFGI